MDTTEAAGDMITWRIDDGDSLASAPLEQAFPLDSLSIAAHRTLKHLQRRGYYTASIARIDTAMGANGIIVTFHIDKGPHTVVGNIRVTGTSAIDSSTVAGLMDTHPGAPVDPGRLETDISRLLTHYQRIGYPLAKIKVTQLAVSGQPPKLTIHLHVSEGEPVELAGIALPGSDRMDPEFVARLLDLQLNERLIGYSPANIRRQLLDTGLFSSVGDPELIVGDNQRAVLRIPVEEAPPGRFNLVLGYEPASGGESGQLVGTGFIHLQNLFGGGRQFHFELDRMTGQVSRVKAGVELPFTAGLPLRTSIRFEGYQQDSTYGTREIIGSLGYVVADGLELSLLVRRKLTRPGVGGLDRSIARAEAWYAGLAVEYEQVDRRYNPQKGFLLRTTFQQGRKRRRDTSEVLLQQRLEAMGRLFIPLFERQVVVLGFDGWILRSPIYVASDLFRIGGTNTLRGYEEEQFLAHLAVRGLLEYRLQIDRRSYVFAFMDLGYIERPAYGSVSRARMLRSGYGVGVQFQTQVGLVKVSYALNPRDGIVDGKVHVGMSLGL